jgi:hypothetical protein
MRGLRNTFSASATAVLMALLISLGTLRARSVEPTIAELKARVSSTELRDRPKLCVQIAERQLQETDRLYTASDDQKGVVALDDVVTYSELARDYAIQSHKYQKQAEIAVRGMTRKISDIMHTLPQAEQVPLQKALSRLQRVRDDLLSAMFSKGNK